jgi:hypothetical protein
MAPSACLVAVLIVALILQATDAAGKWTTTQSFSYTWTKTPLPIRGQRALLSVCLFIYRVVLICSTSPFQTPIHTRAAALQNNAVDSVFLETKMTLRTRTGLQFYWCYVSWCFFLCHMPEFYFTRLLTVMYNFTVRNSFTIQFHVTNYVTCILHFVLNTILHCTDFLASLLHPLYRFSCFNFLFCSAYSLFFLQIFFISNSIVHAFFLLSQILRHTSPLLITKFCSS